MKNFNEFYRETKDRLFAYLLRMTADGDLSRDILQESFTKYLETYGREKLSVPLLYTIARNIFFDDVRSRKPSDRPAEAHENPGPSPEKMLLVREDYHRMMAALKQLKPDEREVLSLVVSSGLPYRTVATIIGISESNVKVKVHRARLKLKTILRAGES